MPDIDYSEFSEPIARVYRDVTDHVIVKIARQFNPKAKTNQDDSTKWQMYKLAQLGQFTEDMTQYIASQTRGAMQDTEKLLYDAVITALDEIEPELIEAAKAGYAEHAVTAKLSPTVKKILQTYSAQAVDQLNLVNTVMLDTATRAYLQVVDNTVRGWKHTSMTAEQLDVAQKALNTATGKVILGVESRQEAMWEAVRKMARAGIAGYVDHGGHEWEPEAYVNMDIRTTAHRVAWETQKARTADYGIDTFQISSKLASREKCAPYQGWICSWNGRRGTVRDLHGNIYMLHSIYDTSFGEPDGIFGINCGHRPVTFIDGYSIPREHELNAAEREENRSQYLTAQKQRQKEVEIRQLKRETAALMAADAPKELIAGRVAAIKAKTAALKDWCKENDRTYRSDRVVCVAFNMELERQGGRTP